MNSKESKVKQYIINIKVIRPKTGETTEEKIGPVFGKKAVNQLTIELIRKRNVIGVKTEEVVK